MDAEELKEFLQEVSELPQMSMENAVGWIEDNAWLAQEALIFLKEDLDV